MLKRMWNIITTILLVLVVFLAAIFFLPKLFGIKPMIVLSGSMEPNYHVGSLVYPVKASPDRIEEGDVITFYMNGTDTVVTHRVIEVDREKQCFYTKGDANEVADGSPVTYQNVIGKVKLNIPYVGYLAKFLNTKQGTILLVTVVAIVMILTFLPDFIMKSGKGVSGGENENA